jgi:peptide/nickel transport system permease protein
MVAALMIEQPEPRRSALIVRVATRFDWLGGLAIGFLILLLIFAVFGDVIAPDANSQDLMSRLQPPAWHDDGSWANPLGTDELGRDVLGRLIVGTRITLMIGFFAAAIEVLIGATLGLVAGYRGGVTESAIMRWADIQMGFPTLLLILLILLTFGSNTQTLILALGLNGWMIFARLMRAEVSRIKNEPFLQAAKAVGMNDTRILRRHVVPHVRSRLVAVYLLEVPRVILAAAGLSFLGLGVSANQVTWGLMIGDSRSIISVAYWPSLFAGLAIVMSVASLYVFASWLEPRLDPMRRRTKQTRRATADKEAPESVASPK